MDAALLGHYQNANYERARRTRIFAGTHANDRVWLVLIVWVIYPFGVFVG
jgi:hypothetical protein